MRILALSKPEIVSGIRGFIGHVSYYWCFINLFIVICQLLTNLLKKPPSNGSSPLWTKECIVAFEELKNNLVFALTLITLYSTKLFQVYIDASNVAIGSVLS